MSNCLVTKLNAVVDGNMPYLNKGVIYVDSSSAITGCRFQMPDGIVRSGIKIIGNGNLTKEPTGDIISGEGEVVKQINYTFSAGTYKVLYDNDVNIPSVNNKEGLKIDLSDFEYSAEFATLGNFYMNKVAYGSINGLRNGSSLVNFTLVDCPCTGDVSIFKNFTGLQTVVFKNNNGGVYGDISSFGKNYGLVTLEIEGTNIGGTIESLVKRLRKGISENATGINFRAYTNSYSKLYFNGVLVPLSLIHI